MHTKMYWLLGYDPGVFATPAGIFSIYQKIKDLSGTGVYLKSPGENAAYFTALPTVHLKSSKPVTLVHAPVHL